MADQPPGEKTLPATARKIQQQRDKGNVPKSQDLNSAVILLVSALGLWALGPGAFRGLLSVMQHYISDSFDMVGQSANLQAMLIQALTMIAMIVAPMMLLLMAAGIAINVLQFGFLFSAQALTPKLERLNPIKGLQRFVSMRSFVELLKSLFKLGFIGFIAVFTIESRAQELLSLMYGNPWDGSLVVWDLVFTVWWRIGLAMLLLGLLDLGFQRWQFGQDQRMSQQEMKEELKQYEGNPLIKQRIRTIQRQMSLNRMMSEVPEADVIVTNPTTYAVALRFDPGTMESPVVVAKGARLTADRIREIAIEHDVPIVERPPLARALYRTMEIGQTIPEDLFRAVAEVLAYIYEIDRRAEKIEERKDYQANALSQALT